MPTLAQDHYTMLGVDRHASAAQIKVAYRKLALRYHPDRNADDPDAERRFKEISHAYATLADPEKRQRYDRFGTVEAEAPFGFGQDLSNATEFFDAVIGDLFGMDRRKKSGQNLSYTLEVDFEDAALGCEKDITFERAEDCRQCSGTGAKGGAAGVISCQRCEGKGSYKQKAGFFSARRACTACGGAGELPKVKCNACLGGGLQMRERTFAVRVPAGSTKGAQQRIAGQGSPGRRGGSNGDLHVQVRVRPHPFFHQDGEILRVCVPITLVDAALGGEVDVPLLDGAIRMKIPAGTQSGGTFRVRGKGVPLPDGTRSELHVVVEVETPTALSEKQQSALRNLATILAGEGHEIYPKRQVFKAAWRRGRDAFGEPDKADRDSKDADDPVQSTVR